MACFLLAELATWTWFVVLAVYAYDEGGAAAVGIAALARMLPAGLVAPAAGHLVDRLSRRDVVVAAVVAQVALAAAAAAAVAADAPLAAVYVLAATSTMATALYRAGSAALALEVADSPTQLAALNVAESTVSNAAFLTGALVGGTVMAVAPPATGFVVVAVIHLASLLPAVLVPRSAVPGHREAGSSTPGPGLTAVLRRPELARLLAFLTVTTLVEGAVDVLVVVVALDLLRMGDAGVGWLNAGWGLGGVAGSLLCVRLLSRGGLARGLSIGGLLIGLSTAGLAATISAPVACALLGMVGIGYALVEVAGRSLLQRLAPDDLVGRAFGMLQAGYWLSTATGAALAPALVGFLGTRPAVAVTGAVLPLVTLLVWRAFSRFERDAAVPEDVYAALRAVAALAPLPPIVVEDLAVHARFRNVTAGEVVVRRGEVDADVFVVAEGAFEVTDCPAPVPPLGAGDVFGELAALHGVRRTATVTAREAGRVVVLDGFAFLTATGSHAYAHRVTDNVARARWSNSERPVS